MPRCRPPATTAHARSAGSAPSSRCPAQPGAQPPPSDATGASTGADTLARLQAGTLVSSTRLNLRGCGLQQLPAQVFDLADTLEWLDLSDNQLSALPEALAGLRRLHLLFCSNNPFTRLPTVLGRCLALAVIGFKANQIHTVPPAALPPTLRWLILTDNLIATPGLVLRRIPTGHHTLAGPPSMDSCTRDVYPPGLRLGGQPSLATARAVRHALLGGLGRCLSCLCTTRPGARRCRPSTGARCAT